jgi:hypothetical protein
MRPIDEIPGEPLDWPRMAPARFEALNDLAALNRDRAISVSGGAKIPHV